MSIDLEDLKPYKSLIVAGLAPETPDDPPGDPLLGVLRDFMTRFEDEETAQCEVVQSVSAPVEVDAATDLQFLVYSEHRTPAWLDDDAQAGLRDTYHHLLLAFRRKERIAFILTDKRRKRKLVSAINASARLHLVPPREVRRQFVRGPARALWMAGIHPSVSIKADSKTLMGSNLRDAIDPLGDQTYLVTAARSLIRDLEMTIGTSPKNSKLWIGPSRDWDDLVDTLIEVLDFLGVEHDEDPLPFVPSIADVGHGVTLAEASEIALLPPEYLLEAQDLSQEEREMMDRWAYRSQWDIVGKSAKTVDVAVVLDGQDLGTIRLEVDLDDPEDVAIGLDSMDLDDSLDDELQDEVKQMAQQGSWLRIWFDSGHTLVDQQLCIQQFIDLKFEDFQWENFEGHKIFQEKFWGHKEKIPDEPLKAIAKSKSLFTWVYNNWPGKNQHTRNRGWLACDDGSMEIADFIHFDDQADPPVLSLIHVKAAKVDKKKRKDFDKNPDRAIKVADYQVVVSQALRNLRYLFRPNIAREFEDTLHKKISQLVWYDGQPSDREALVAVILEKASSYRRHVVIVQPQVLKKRLAAARDYKADEPDKGGKKAQEHAAAKQLDALLLATAQSCRQLQADFTVVADHRG